MRRLPAFALLFLLSFGSASALEEPTRLWLSIRGAAHFFTDGKHDDLEALSFALSNPRYDRPIEFYEKSWEIPFGARLGLQISPDLSFYLLYERMPYLLDAERAPTDPSDFADPRSDTVILRAPANMVGGGVDMALFRGTYGGTIRVGAAGGIMDISGEDEDFVGRSNYLIDAKGWFVDFYGSLEYDFSRELTLYPFAQLRISKARDYEVTHFDSDPVPDFEIDYTGLAIGLEIRIRAWPLPTGGKH